MNKKLYPCKSCQTFVPIRSKGLCTMCRYKQKGSQTKRYIIKQQSERVKLKKKNKTEVMKPYWEYHMSVLEKGKDCENCDKKLSASVVSICHILPKQRHSDVMDNFLNCIYLCDFCHSRFDRIQTTSQVYLMSVFPIALERYLQFRESVVIYSRYKEIFEDYLKEKDGK